MSKHQKGFTLIELVIVIVILGILAATALPRFLNVSDQAHASAVAGTGGSFGTAVMLAHAGWIANGQVSPVVMDSQNVTMNATGWPAATTGATCVTDVWNTIMQNPPSASAAAGSNYLVTFAGGLCVFNYRGNASLPANDLGLTYNPATGQVIVDNTIDGV